MPPASAGASTLSPGDVADPWQTWLRARARLAPGVFVQSPPWVRGVFDHSWAPMQALSGHIRSLPSALMAHLLGSGGGWVVIAAGESQYVPGPGTIRQRPVQNIAYVSVQDLARGNELPLHVIGHLVDHHLGCGGDPEGLWLSGGGGLVPAWQQAGERLTRLFVLGYGIDEVARSSVREYFAQSLAWHCRDRQRLNVADPQIDKWFRATLWRGSFWKAMD